VFECFPREPASNVVKKRLDPLRISDEELNTRLKEELKEYGIKDPLETTIEIMNQMIKEQKSE